MDAQRPPSLESRVNRGRYRSGGPQGRSDRREDLARHEADRGGSVVGATDQEADAPTNQACEDEVQESYIKFKEEIA